MKKTLQILTIASLGLGLASPASAVVTTWDFTGLGNGVSNTMTFAGDDGKTLKAWGFNTGSKVNKFFPAGPEVKQKVTLHNGQGLGVRSGSGNYNDQINDQKKNEFLVLQLPTDQWGAVSITISNLFKGHENKGQDDFKIYGALAGAVSEGGGTLSFSNNIANYVLLAADGIDAPNAQKGNITKKYLLGGVKSEFIIAVAHKRGGPQNDGFRVAGFQGEVPEPGTLAIFGIGLLGLGLARRRRKAA
jgi:hypothetical protein